MGSGMGGGGNEMGYLKGKKTFTGCSAEDPRNQPRKKFRGPVLRTRSAEHFFFLLFRGPFRRCGLRIRPQNRFGLFFFLQKRERKIEEKMVSTFGLKVIK